MNKSPIHGQISVKELNESDSVSTFTSTRLSIGSASIGFGRRKQDQRKVHNCIKILQFSRLETKKESSFFTSLFKEFNPIPCAPCRARNDAGFE